MQGSYARTSFITAAGPSPRLAVARWHADHRSAGTCQRGQEPGAQDRQHVGSLHGLRVVEAVQHLDVPAVPLELRALLHQWAGKAHVHAAPAFAVVDLVRRAREAEPRAGDPRLGGTVVEALQRLVEG